METALVGVSTGVMDRLLSKLSMLLEKYYHKLRGVSKQIKLLRDEMRAMRPALLMLADEEQLNPLTKEWRDELRELAYDTEDCVDDFMARVVHEEEGPAGILGILSRYKKLLKALTTRHEIANEVEELKARAIEANERYNRYNFIQAASTNSSTFAIDPRLPALYEDIDRLVGIDRPKKHIIERLLNDSSDELKVFSIVGCGGLGKTTLANQVYHTIKGQFPCAAFVTVSRNPDIRRILCNISRGVGITYNRPDDDVGQLIDTLREHLQDKRYLIVIDDIWNENAWGIIRCALINNILGSRIITTTRSFTVGRCCSSQGGNVYQMKPLSFGDSKTLFFRRAVGAENSHYPHLEDVLDVIVEKCGGLPLAIITLSGVLADQYVKSEWDRVLNGIGSGLAVDPNAENMTKILALSFFDLPRHLKACLLYLSVFPEDCEIRKERLIPRWIAEGFVHEKQGQSTYEIGECYFNGLINRSLTQPVDVKNGQPNACRVHDIILDYIKCKAAEENFVTYFNAAGHGQSSEYKVRRLCVDNHAGQNVDICARRIMSHVRSFTLFGHPVKISSLPSTALRVLDLGYCWDMKASHLAGIEKLVHLKYLRLCSDSITKLPEKIEELQHLQTLDVRETGIGELPPTITRLQRLTHLYVSSITAFPVGVIGQMHSLEELGEYAVSFKHGNFFQELSMLTKLRTLRIGFCSGFGYIPEPLQRILPIHDVGTLLSASRRLHNLSISGAFGLPLSLRSWNPTAVPCNLRELCLEDTLIYDLPSWMGTFGNLRVLKLEIIFVWPDDVEILGAIPGLVFLRLETNLGAKGNIIVRGSNGFRNLKQFHLSIYTCGTYLEFEAGSMPKLEHLVYEFPMHKMECMDSVCKLGIQNLPALSKVEVQIDVHFRHGRLYDPAEYTRGPRG